jgi:cysteinyl-tRNA synthetase
MKIYNSLTRIKEEFTPLKSGHVGMYVCGPTVYDEPHIGHARSAYIFDVVRRYFEYRKYKVTFVRNVTDVDDKIIEKAKKEPAPEGLSAGVKNVSRRYLDAYHEDMKLLGIRPPDTEPKATEYIAKMIKFIELLIEKGRAYPAGGDVYFDIKKADRYGKLSNQNLDKMESGARVAAGENKRDPMDFALWKKAKEEEPFWDSPWGPGRPGWHIECSAMSSDILGEEFDIHGGGIDLIFPHHENEIAQSEGAGKRFARYWMHNGLLTIKSEKMAKSLGNFISIKSFMSKYKDADFLKLLFLNTHYRHPVDYTEEKIAGMRAEKERIAIAMERMGRAGKAEPARGSKKADGFRKKFEDAMDDDFNMPLALASVFEAVNEVNRNPDDTAFFKAAFELISEIAGVFGLSLSISRDDSSPDVKSSIDRRNAARKSGDYKEADRIRLELLANGIILEDTKDGTTWRKKI